MDSPTRRSTYSQPTMASTQNPSVIIDIGFMSNDEFADMYNDKAPPTLDKMSCSFAQMERQPTPSHDVGKKDEECSQKRCCSPWF